MIPNRGERCVIREPFHCDTGNHIYLGDNVFINVNCTFLDTTRIDIGDGALIGPDVKIYTGFHVGPDLETRHEAVFIGQRVWIGGGAIILPGITIEDRAIIGAGSVVTRNVPAGATVMGNPARIRT